MWKIRERPSFGGPPRGLTGSEMTDFMPFACGMHYWMTTLVLHFRNLCKNQTWLPIAAPFLSLFDGQMNTRWFAKYAKLTNANVQSQRTWTVGVVTNSESNAIAAFNSLGRCIDSRTIATPLSPSPVSVGIATGSLLSANAHWLFMC